jgi:hypothetical protein
MHPLHKLRESGRSTPAEVSKLLAENVVFHSPALVRAVEGREKVTAIFAASANVRQGAAQRKQELQTTLARLRLAPEALNCSDQIDGAEVPWKPVRVFDDGTTCTSSRSG